MYYKVRPVNHGSLTLNLNHVFSKRKGEKLLYTVAT